MSGLGIQTGGRFVQDQELGLVHERSGDQQPPLHPSRQGVDPPVALVLEGDERQQLGADQSAIGRLACVSDAVVIARGLTKRFGDFEAVKATW